MILELILVSILLGLIPAAIAHARGLPFLTWWLYGALIWPVALIHVFFAKPGSVTIVGRPAPTRTCPFCAEPIRQEAKVCKHCGRDLVTPAPQPGPQTPPARSAPPPRRRDDDEPGRVWDIGTKK